MASETPLSDVRFLTVAEVALIMRVSKMTVYRLVHSGAGSDPRRTLLPGAGSRGQPISERRLRRHRLNRPTGRADRSGPRRVRLACGRTAEEAAVRPGRPRDVL